MGKGRRKQMSKGRSGGDHKGGVHSAPETVSKPTKSFDEGLEDYQNEREQSDSDEDNLQFIDDRKEEEDVENAFDMGGSDDSSSDSDSDSDDVEDDDLPTAMDPAESSSDEESDDENNDPSFTWGSRKNQYYKGDTADLEIGQSEQDAFDEAEAAREIMDGMHDDMKEDDFFDDDEEEEEEEEETTSKKSSKKKGLKTSKTTIQKSDLSDLTSKKKLELLSKSDPALPALLKYFQKKVTELRTIVLPVISAIDSESRGVLGTNSAGYNFLNAKKEALTSIILNACVYFKLRLDPNVTSRDLENHPVVQRLNELEGCLGKLRKIEVRDGLEKQVRKVLEAVELMKEEEGGGEEEDEEEDEEDMEEEEVGGDEEGGEFNDIKIGENEESDDDEDESEMDDDLFDDAPTSKSLKPVRRAAPPSSSSKVTTDEVDGAGEDEEKIKRALAAMAADLKNYNDGLSDPDNFDGNDSDEDSEVDELDIKLSDHDASELYHAASKASKDKKKMKKDLYAVAPKFPSKDELVEGERKANYKILKNRGLVAHKAKINRNPRVKKREQYRKKLIARNGAVRKVRTGEAEGYAGEGTGIKSNLSRSKKLRS